MPVTKFRVASHNVVREVLTSFECSWAVLLVNTRRAFPDQLKDRSVRFIMLEGRDGVRIGAKITDAKTFWQSVATLYDANSCVYVIYDDHPVDLEFKLPSTAFAFCKIGFYSPMNELIQSVCRLHSQTAPSEVDGIIVLNAKEAQIGPVLRTDDDFWQRYISLLNSPSSYCFSLNLSSSSAAANIPPPPLAAELNEYEIPANATLYSLLFSSGLSNYAPVHVTVSQSMSWTDIKQTVSAIVVPGKHISHFIMLDSDGDDFSSRLDNPEKFWKIALKHCQPDAASQTFVFKIFADESVAAAVPPPAAAPSPSPAAAAEASPAPLPEPAVQPVAPAEPAPAQAPIPEVEVIKVEAPALEAVAVLPVEPYKSAAARAEEVAKPPPAVPQQPVARLFPVRLMLDSHRRGNAGDMLTGSITVSPGSSWDAITDLIWKSLKLPSSQCISYLTPSTAGASSGGKASEVMVCTRSQFWNAVKRADDEKSELTFNVHVYPNTVIAKTEEHSGISFVSFSVVP
jgi:hypothetical protein